MLTVRGLGSPFKIYQLLGLGLGVSTRLREGGGDFCHAPLQAAVDALLLVVISIRLQACQIAEVEGVEAVGQVVVLADQALERLTRLAQGFDVFAVDVLAYAHPDLGR